MELGHPHIYKNHFDIKIFDLGDKVANVNKIHMHACSAMMLVMPGTHKIYKNPPSRTQRAASITRINH